MADIHVHHPRRKACLPPLRPDRPAARAVRVPRAQQLEDVRRQFDDVHARLTNLEPASDAQALVALGTGATVPMQTHGDVYDAKRALAGPLYPRGALVYNTTNPEHPKRAFRAAPTRMRASPQSACTCAATTTTSTPSPCTTFCWPTVLAHKDHGEGLQLYLSRVGREKTSEELAQDALMIPHCPSVIVELCGSARSATRPSSRRPCTLHTGARHLWFSRTRSSNSRASVPI